MSRAGSGNMSARSRRRRRTAACSSTTTPMKPHAAQRSRCVQVLNLFRQKLTEPYGVSLDSFTLDDGWDDKNSLWKITPSNFPHGFAPLLKALPSGTKLGLWISPSSGYGHSGWLGNRATNSTPIRGGCASRIPNIPRHDQGHHRPGKGQRLAFLKLNTWAANCDATGHEHLPGNYSKEASIDAYPELSHRHPQDAAEDLPRPNLRRLAQPVVSPEADALVGRSLGRHSAQQHRAGLERD